MRAPQLIKDLVLTSLLMLGLAGHAKSVTICTGACIPVVVEAPSSVTGLNVPLGSAWLEPAVLQLMPFAGDSGWTYGFGLVNPQGGVISLALPNVPAWDLGTGFLPGAWDRVMESPTSDNPLGSVVWTALEGTAGIDARLYVELHSPHAPTQAALRIRDANGVVYTREIFLPLTNEALAAGYRLVEMPSLPAVPEPSGVLMFALGAAMAAAGGMKASRQCA